VGSQGHRYKRLLLNFEVFTLICQHVSSRSFQTLDRETETVQDFPMKVFTTPYAISLGPNSE